MKSILSALFILLVPGLIMLTSCKGGSKSDSQSIVIDESELTKEQAIREVTEYPLPTSFEVTTLLIDAGASYILDLSNNVENVNKYITLKSKALNLGVFGADLSYAATYNQSQETMQFLKVSSQLIDELQVSGAFDQRLVEKVENNIDNVDSLINIISDSFYETYYHLRENDQDELSILVMAGSWIEAIYITSQISLISQNNEELLRIISQQYPSLAKLLEIMEPARESEMIADVYADLTNIRGIFDEAGETFTDEDLEKLEAEIEEIRNRIVS